ncbi:COP23 domain-containing protein [Trichormus sp. NMC-1]|uniref:COP23 domain-containing protein n=1 Tax=Trichormus sp. NMC-1 TaxID=1853259 RepID=UPI0008DC1ADB|nr:COP23 domain-containing protein [Trichormus sp. NMC-1]
MSGNKSIFDEVHLVVGVIGAVVGIAGLVLTYSLAIGWTPTVPGFGAKDRFSCSQQPDTQSGGQVWAVMYRNEQGIRPWLKMVHNLGEDWDTLRRCAEIADRLEKFRQDGLIGLSYRNDANTPGQAVICATTRLDPKSCNLLVTLRPKADGYSSLRNMTEALRTGGSVEQGSGGGSQATENSQEVNLENFLAEDDRKVVIGGK